MFALIAISAQAQVPTHYGETYEKETGKLRGKAWISPQTGFRQETPGKDGHASVIIFRRDSMMAYVLNPAKKTYISIPFSQITDAGKLSGIEGFEEQSHNSKRTLVNKEVIEGVECDHYFVERTGQRKDGGTEYNNYDEWIAPDKIWRQRSDETRPGRYLVHRNIRIGQVAAHLLEIPKDFKGTTMPGGGMLEMLTGKSQGENMQKQQDAQKGVQDIFDNAKKSKTDTEGKSDNEQLKDALKMLEGTTKKK
jgi:hypothetical protein